mmetsp:Transcript_16082/g.60855  ORF Transcript_16082/g.60855 Transcript_16082/m.60855 type:complete len:292 (-) Transcript_16082:1139-2014(-)
MSSGRLPPLCHSCCGNPCWRRGPAALPGRLCCRTASPSALPPSPPLPCVSSSCLLRLCVVACHLPRTARCGLFAFIARLVQGSFPSRQAGEHSKHECARVAAVCALQHAQRCQMPKRPAAPAGYRAPGCPQAGYPPTPDFRPAKPRLAPRECPCACSASCTAFVALGIPGRELRGRNGAASPGASQRGASAQPRVRVDRKARVSPGLLERCERCERCEPWERADGAAEVDRLPLARDWWDLAEKAAASFAGLPAATGEAGCSEAACCLAEAKRDPGGLATRSPAGSSPGVA